MNAKVRKQTIIMIGMIGISDADVLLVFRTHFYIGHCLANQTQFDEM